MLGGMRLLVVGACALAAAALSGTSSSTAPPALLTYSISYGDIPSPVNNCMVASASRIRTELTRFAC